MAGTLGWSRVLNVIIRLNILAVTENILLSYNYCTGFLGSGEQANVTAKK